MRESVRVRACSNLPGADITSLIHGHADGDKVSVETPNLFRWLFDDVFQGVNVGVKVFWDCGLR